MPRYLALVLARARAPGLHVAAGTRDAAVVSALLQEGAAVDECDLLARTPLMEAAKASSVEAVKLLIELGADASASALDRQHALHEAMEEEGMDVVRSLVEAGCDVNACGTANAVALHGAAAIGNATPFGPCLRRVPIRALADTTRLSLCLWQPSKGISTPFGPCLKAARIRVHRSPKSYHPCRSRIAEVMNRSPPSSRAQQARTTTTS